MKNKTPLVIMEQTIMILVFALATAVCMQVLVYSDKLSRNNQQRNDAVIIAQNAAEMLKFSDGELHSPIYYDENGQQISEKDNAAYQLNVTYTENDDPNLWKATVEVIRSDNTTLFELPVAGQRWEVHSDG